jgi:hypothetical protein
MNMSADSKLRSHPPKSLSQSFTASSSTLIRLIAMRSGWRVRHDDIRIKGYRLPERRQV